METIDTKPPLVVCDAGPLIHLDEVGAIDLLADFPVILVPHAVWVEVERNRPSALEHPDLTLRRISPQLPEPPELEALAQVLSLHTGEWEALRVALENRPGLLLTDDTAARLAAASLGIATHGTLGILIRAIRRQQRSKQEIIDALQSLPTHSTLHLKRSLLDEVIDQVNQT